MKYKESDSTEKFENDDFSKFASKDYRESDSFDREDSSVTIHKLEDSERELANLIREGLGRLPEPLRTTDFDVHLGLVTIETLGLSIEERGEIRSVLREIPGVRNIDFRDTLGA